MTHKALLRQLSRLGLNNKSRPDAESWQKFIDTVDKSYKAHDEDRYLLERSLEVSSTEMQKMYDELKRSSQSTMKIMLDSMQNGVISIDSTGKILSYNNSAHSIFGYSQAEVIEQNIKMLMPEQYHQQHDESIRKNFSNMLSIPIEVAAQHKDGHEFPLLFMLSELPVANEKQFIISCFDMTHQKQMNEQIRRSQKMDALGKLTGGIAHDYNNLLGAMIGFAELIELKVKDNEKLTGYAWQIIKAGRRGTQLTKKLLAFSRLHPEESTQVNINLILKNLNEVLEKTLTVRVQTTMRLQDEIWPVWINQDELENTLLNLAVNAMHSMPEGGALDIVTENVHLSATQSLVINLPAGDFVKLSMTDTGCGMDEDTLSQIFDPFFTTKGEKGTGLGLSQVHTFVKHSSGGIHMESSLHQGTTISLYFPRYSGRRAEVLNDTEYKNIDQHGSARILVVDDEPSLCFFVSEVLSGHGYDVLQANSGEEALAHLSEHPIDLLISDILMPGMDGYQLAKHVRQQYPHIKIQLMSGYTDNRQSTQNDKILSESMLRKPVSSRGILEKVAELLEGL